jgi:hypothetical protein
MSFLCAQNFSYQDLSNDTALHQIKLNSTTDSDANVKKLTISLASAYPNLYSPLAEIDFGIKTSYKFYNRTEDGSVTKSVVSFNFSLPIFLNKTFHVAFFNHTGQPADTSTAPRMVFSLFAGKMNLTVYALMNKTQFSNIHRTDTIPSNLDCDIPTCIHEAQYIPRQVLPCQSNIAEQPIPLDLVTPATKTIMLNAQKLNYKWLPGPIRAMTNWTNITYYEISSYAAPNYTLDGLITSNQVKKSACTRPLVHVKPIYKIAQASNHTLWWWSNAGMCIQELTKIHHYGVLYAFSFLLPWKGRWHTVDFVAHKPRWRNIHPVQCQQKEYQFLCLDMIGTQYTIQKFHLKKCWMKDFSDTMCIV